MAQASPVFGYYKGQAIVLKRTLTALAILALHVGALQCYLPGGPPGTGFEYYLAVDHAIYRLGYGFDVGLAAQLQLGDATEIVSGSEALDGLEVAHSYEDAREASEILGQRSRTNIWVVVSAAQIQSNTILQIGAQICTDRCANHPITNGRGTHIHLL